MTTHTHELNGITKTLDDSVVGVLLDEGKQIDDATNTLFAAAHDLITKVADSTVAVADVYEFANACIEDDILAAVTDIQDKVTAETIAASDLIAFADLCGITLVEPT